MKIAGREVRMLDEGATYFEGVPREPNEEEARLIAEDLRLSPDLPRGEHRTGNGFEIALRFEILD